MFPLASRRSIGLVLAAALVVWSAILWPLHDALSMWVEGMPAYVDQLLGVIRRACTPPVNVIEFAGRLIPLAIDPYQGPLMTYLDVPAARAWLAALTDDMYVYRYKGIVILAVTGMLMYAVLLRVAQPVVAALGAMVFVTLPAVTVTALSDIQYHIPLLTAILAIVAAAAKYVETRRTVWWLATAFAAGVAMLTRAEALIWLVAAATVWIAIAWREAVVRWWRTTPRKTLLLLGGVAAFLIGAAPFVVMNYRYPDYGLFSFLFVRGPTRMTSAGQLVGALEARGLQFIDYLLLNRFWLFDARVRHFAFLVLGLGSIAALAVLAVRQRRLPFSLVALLVVLPLSAVANRGPREIHLLPLAIPLIAIVAEACGHLRLRHAVALLAAAIGANLVAGYLILGDWQSLRLTNTSMVGHSCPECLAKALVPHAGGQLRFTNVGLYQEALWASRANACGPDILSWGSDAEFVRSVENAIAAGGRLIFVGYPPEREDALRGRVLVRARALDATLRSAGVDFRNELIAGPNGLPYYQLTVTAPLPPRLVAESAGVNAPAAGQVTGWIVGRGFRPSDRVVLDGVVYPATFGHSGLLTFSMDAQQAGARSSLQVEVIGDDEARSERLRVPLN